MGAAILQTFSIDLRVKRVLNVKAMSSDEKPNGETMENEQKEEEMKTAPEDAKDDAEDQKDEKDGEGNKEAEGEEEEEEEESSDEEELPLGSVEAPVQIMTGKRDRKKVERLIIKETPKTPEKKFEVPVGKGVKIGEIPIIAHFLEKTKSQDLKPLHRFLFGRVVRDPRDTKKNIRVFTGFDFTKEDAEFTKRETILGKFTMEGIKELCTILDVEKKGKKDVIMDRIMEFCLNPQPSGRTLPEKGKKKGKAKAAKKKKPKAKKQKGEGKKGGGDASTGTEDGNTTIDDGTEGDAEGEDGDTSMTEGESKPKKKKSPKKTPKPKKDSAKAKPKSPKKKKIAVKTPSKETKKSNPAKSPKKTPQKRNHDDIDDTSSDDEPLTKKIKGPPSDKQIKETVKEILAGANLEEVTMKMVCRKVYDTYPQHPLHSKKDFIKSTVREIIS